MTSDRSPRRRLTLTRRLSVVAPLALTVALFVALVGVVVVVVDEPRYEFGLEEFVFVLFVAAWASLHATVGTVIAWRRPGNRIGRIMQAAGPLLVSVFLGYVVGAWRYELAGPTDLLGGIAAWWGSTAILGSIVVALPVLGVIFPDGRLPTPRFRRPIQLVLAGILVPTVLLAAGAGPVDAGLADNPFGLVELSPDARALLGLVSTVALLSGFALAVASIALRWRRGDALERAQLKWLLAAFALGSVLFAMSWAGPDDGPLDIVDTLSVAGAMLVPIAIGVAVLRYRLYEIDRLVSRTIGWASVTGILVAIFAAAVLALQTVLSGVTQGETVAVAASTLVAFALFQPVRRHVQAAVDRRFDRARYDGQRTMSQFSERVRDEVDLARILTSLVTTADDAVRPSASGMWLRARRGERP